MNRYCICVLLMQLVVFNVSGQDVEKIPQRVYFEIEEPSQPSPLVSEAVQLFYTQLSKQIYTIPAEDKEKAHSIFYFSISDLDVDISLVQEDQVVMNRRIPIAAVSAEPHIEAFGKAASDFSEYLAFVYPEITSFREQSQSETEKLIRRIEFADSLKKKNTISFYGLGNFTGAPYLPEADSKVTGGEIKFFPIFLDYTRFLNENVGIVGSFFYNDTDIYPMGLNTTFSRDADGNVVDFEMISADTQVQFFIPGIGVHFRTLGRIALGMQALLYAGPIRITALEDFTHWYRPTDDWNYVEKGLSLAAGESAWDWVRYLAFQPYIALNITQNLAVKVRSVLMFDPWSLFSKPITHRRYNNNAVVSVLHYQAGAGFSW